MDHPLDAGQTPPLWLTLRYLLTAFDMGRDSDTWAAHELLGEGMLALRELNFLRPASPSLADNPEPLKITFDSADSERLSTLMQGSDEKYRLSVAFEVRPVMIAPAVPPAYALPVETVGSGDDGPVVLPSLGPKLERMDPEALATGDVTTLYGLDINTAIGEVRFGASGYPVIAAHPGWIKVMIPADTTLSAGSYAVRAVRTLPGGMQVSSNALLGHLLPTVTGAVPSALVNAAGMVTGTLTVDGVRLGGPTDHIFIAFYRDGGVARMFEASGVAAQDTLTLAVSGDSALPEGEYFIIVRVNGEQARTAPLVSWS